MIGESNQTIKLNNLTAISCQQQAIFLRDEVRFLLNQHAWLNFHSASFLLNQHAWLNFHSGSFLLNQHAWLNYHSASILKQQSASSHMLHHSDTLSWYRENWSFNLLINAACWYRANQPLNFLINVTCLAEKQRMPILLSLVWPDRL